MERGLRGLVAGASPTLCRGALSLQLSHGQLPPRSTLPAEKPNRILVNRAAGAKGNKFDQIVAKLLSRRGILTDDVEARPDLALEAGMKTPDEILDGLRNAKAVDDRVSGRGLALRVYRSVHPS